jgi:hypothetical protein
MVTDLWMPYVVTLDVFGATEAARWYLQNDVQNSTYTTMKNIPGGVEMRFPAIVVVYGPDYLPVHLTGELFVYAGGATEREVQLTYADGGLTVGKSACPVG